MRFLLLLTALAAALRAEPLLDRAPGVVSYAYRREFKQDFAGTLDRVRALGVTEIEFSALFGQEPAKIRAALDSRGMVCTSYGAAYADALGKTDEVAAVAKTLGARYVRVSLPGGKKPFDKAEASLRAAELNTVGRKLREQHGLAFCVHNHGMEFAPDGAGTLYDFLLAQTRPEDVAYELDVLWAYLPGADPAALLARYPGRFPLMHVKDVRKGLPRVWGPKYDSDNDVAVGTGQLDQAAIFAAARKAGVKHYYIEDESSRTAEQVPQSLAYLRTDR